MTPQTAITTLHNLSTWGRLSADQRTAILAGLAALREARDREYAEWVGRKA